jgi:hypothetical protein
MKFKQIINSTSKQNMKLLDITESPTKSQISFKIAQKKVCFHNQFLKV